MYCVKSLTPTENEFSDPPPLDRPFGSEVAFESNHLADRSLDLNP